MTTRQWQCFFIPRESLLLSNPLKGDVCCFFIGRLPPPQCVPPFMPLSRFGNLSLRSMQIVFKFNSIMPKGNLL